MYEARRTGGRPSGVPCALPKDGFEYREGREKPLDPDLADVSSKKNNNQTHAPKLYLHFFCGEP